MKISTRYKPLVAFLVSALLLVFTAPFAIPVALAAPDSTGIRVFDEQGLLTEAQESELNAKLNEVSDKHNFDLVVATVGDLGGKEARLYAADFYEEQGFGANGAIFIVSPLERDWGFATCGFGKDAFTFTGQAMLQDWFLPDLKNDRYFEAFMSWADGADEFLAAYEKGNAFGTNSTGSNQNQNRPTTPQQKRENATIGYAISIGLGLILGIGIPCFWRSKLKSVRPQNTARSYVPKGGFAVTGQSDVLISRHVTSTPRPTNSSSSSGSSFSGGGSSFSSSSGGSWSGSSGKY